jgi:maleylacetate reductase
LHHKICHVLGGVYDLPHAETHAVVLPYVVAFNVPAAGLVADAAPPSNPRPVTKDDAEELLRLAWGGDR